MKTLVAFTLLVAAVLAEPQYIYSGVPTGYSGYYGGVYPYSSSVVSPVATPYASQYVSPYVSPYASPVVARAAYPAVTYPVQDTSRGLPQPVQDTFEVKAAKSAFAAEYAQTVARNAGAISVPVHSIHKREAQVYTTPVVGFKSPASTVYTGTPYVASPYAASPYVASPYVASPYVSSYTGGYTYGAYPYKTYPYVY